MENYTPYYIFGGFIILLLVVIILSNGGGWTRTYNELVRTLNIGTKPWGKLKARDGQGGSVEILNYMPDAGTDRDDLPRQTATTTPAGYGYPSYWPPFTPPPVAGVIPPVGDGAVLKPVTPDAINVFQTALGQPVIFIGPAIANGVGVFYCWKIGGGAYSAMNFVESGKQIVFPAAAPFVAPAVLTIKIQAFGPGGKGAEKEMAPYPII